jgi:hypothetical protein
MSTKKQAERPDSAKLLNLAERLRAGEDPTRIADELERLAAELGGRGPGRPKAPPDERAMQRYMRASYAEAVYQGTLPASLYPSDLALIVREAKGKRNEADAVAAQILCVSLRTIQAARVSDRRPMSGEHFQELLAVLRSAHRS